MGQRAGYRNRLCLLLPAVIAILAPFSPAQESPIVSTQAVQKVINDLGAAKSAVRKAAQQKLLALSAGNPQLVVDEGVKAYAANLADPEISTRLWQVLSEVVPPYCLPKSPGFLGVNVTMGQAAGSKGEAQAAVYVNDVISSTGAEQGGLLQGDFILAIDNLDIARNPDLDTYLKYVRSRKPGAVAKLVIRRGDEILNLQIKVGEMPQEYQGDPETRKIEMQEQFEQWLRERVEKEQAKARP